MHLCTLSVSTVQILYEEVNLCFIAMPCISVANAAVCSLFLRPPQESCYHLSAPSCPSPEAHLHSLDVVPSRGPFPAHCPLNTLPATFLSPKSVSLPSSLKCQPKISICLSEVPKQMPQTHFKPNLPKKTTITPWPALTSCPLYLSWQVGPLTWRCSWEPENHLHLRLAHLSHPLIP